MHIRSAHTFRVLPSALRGLFIVLLVTVPAIVPAQPLGGTATTESVCNFGMQKDEPAQSCEVPIPLGCKVANFPGTSKPWTNVSKGGNTQCAFDDERTDWKTKITGACGTCRTERCSARFSVMFSCGGGASPFTPQTPRR